MNRIQVAIVDDADLVREGLTSMLSPFHGRIEVVSASADGSEPIFADIALVDAYGHPDQALQRIGEVQRHGTVDYVALYTWRISANGARSFLEAGVAGVLSKAATAAHTARSIELLSEGKQVVDEFAPFHAPSWSEVGATLTARDIEILTLVAAGYDNLEIGGELYLAESTIKTYVKRLYQSLGVHTRAQAVLRAVELGLTNHQPGR